MAHELRFPPTSEKGDTKIRNVPIAVTPEGFWCCPSPVVFQRTLKSHHTHPHPLNKSPKPTPSPPPPPPTSKQPSPNPAARKQSPSSTDKKQPSSQSKVKPPPPTPSVDDNHKKSPGLDNVTAAAAAASSPPNTYGNGRSSSCTTANNNNNNVKGESLPRKVSIEFGEPGTSDMKLVLFAKHGFSVKLNVHKSVVVEFSSFFADKVAAAAAAAAQEEYDSDNNSLSVCIVEITDCDDVEIYVETVGLMYCKDMKHRLMKQSVQRVLRILKVAEIISFNSCVRSCLDYLEAVPWVGEEEEEKVVSSVLQLKNEGTAGVTPILKRVTSSQVSKPPKDTLSYIIDMVLKSNEERGRREMKSIVLKLLKENNVASSSSSNPCRAQPSPDICYETIYESCRSCLESLLSHFKQASEPEFRDKPSDTRDSVLKQIALEADNLSWLLEILTERHVADEFALIWSSQQELACLHSKLQTMNRYHVSCVTARLFVGIGRGELLPSKDVRHLLLQTWLQPLMNDYVWLQHGCRLFDRKVVEEGIGRTILTLPLEDQQSILLSWLGTFLKSGDSCPNLQKAFEVWWRRTFIRPYGDSRGGGSGTRRDQLGMLLTTDAMDLN